jgi:hypothetical protein
VLDLVAAHSQGIKVERDLIRLRSAEHHCNLEAFTCSDISQNIDSDRHLHLDLKARDVCDSIREKGCFDQMSFDWQNMPDAYFRTKVGTKSLCVLLKSISASPTPLLNPQGGAIFLPFILEYYISVVINLAELEERYQVDFVAEDVISEECHLYRGTEALDLDLKKVFQIREIKSCCEISRALINKSCPSEVEAEMKKHYGMLRKKMDVESIRMIRLVVKPPAQANGDSDVEEEPQPYGYVYTRFFK